MSKIFSFSILQSPSNNSSNVKRGEGSDYLSISKLCSELSILEVNMK